VALASAANLHRAFEVALILKLVNAILELVSGAVLLFISNGAILAIANALTQSELLEDPNDIFANVILRTADDLSLGAKTTAGFFLCSHGAVKLVLVVGVMLGLGWAYPAFIAALAILIAYQAYQLSHIFSAALFGLTVLDAVLLALTVHEYVLRRRHAAA